MMDMAEAARDVAFVRGVVAKRDALQPRPSAIFYFWAVYVLIGFPMVNFAPQYSGMFFLMGIAAGIVFSGIVARRHFARFGEVDVGERIRGGIHWVTGMLVAVAVPIILANMKMISGDVAGQFSCILVGVVYLMAGIHIDRPFFWMGLLLIAGGMCLGLLPGYGWTVLGVLLGGSLFLTGLLGSASRPMGAGMVCGKRAACGAAKAAEKKAE